jgi:hypothetical protein
MTASAQWFDASIRERTIGKVAHQPGMSREALAAKVRSRTGWNVLG